MKVVLQHTRDDATMAIGTLTLMAVMALTFLVVLSIGASSARAATSPSSKMASASQCKAAGNVPVLSFDQQHVVCVKKDAVVWVR